MVQLETMQLKLLLEYEHEDMISRFMDMYKLEEKETKDIFKETLKFLYISQKPEVFISDDLLILDEMWHNMILFTSAYHSFSAQYFNQYFHHQPASKKEKDLRHQAFLIDPENAREEYLEKLENMISITYDHLGEETVIKWFEVYPQKYSKEHIKALRK